MSKFDCAGTEVHYEMMGEGKPLMLLHGNTASSKMFAPIIDFYKSQFKLILMDYPGHGQSQRLAEFPVDFWYENAGAVIALLRNLELGKVTLIGSSGGAQVALNVALECPEAVNKVVADSFEGEKSVASFAEGVEEERGNSKKEEGARAFWRYNHGPDWERVVDQDTRAIKRHHATIGRFFHQELSMLKVPVLLMGSKEDEYLGAAIAEIYEDLAKKIPDSRIHLFPTGGHPALLSNAGDAFKAVKEFVDR